MDPATIQMILSGLMAGGGLAGGLFGGGSNSIEDTLTRQLMTQARQGIDVNEYVKPQLNAINQSYAQSLNDQRVNLARSGMANTSAGAQAPSQLFQQKGAMVGNAYDNANAQNQAAKERARSMLMQILGLKNDRDVASAQGYGALTSAGLQGLLRGMNGMGNTSSEFGPNTNWQDIMRQGHGG